MNNKRPLIKDLDETRQTPDPKKQSTNPIEPSVPVTDTFQEPGPSSVYEQGTYNPGRRTTRSQSRQYLTDQNRPFRDTSPELPPFRVVKKTTKSKTTNSLKESRKSLEKLLEDLPREERNDQELLNELLVNSPPSRSPRFSQSPESVVSQENARNQPEQVEEEAQVENVGFPPCRLNFSNISSIHDVSSGEPFEEPNSTIEMNPEPAPLENFLVLIPEYSGKCSELSAFIKIVDRLVAQRLMSEAERIRFGLTVRSKLKGNCFGRK